MDVAIAHDYLTQRGGAERVVLRLASLFPDAPIFTAIYDPDHTFEEFKGRTVITSELQGRIDPAAFRRAVLRFPGAFRRFNLHEADRVVISSSAFAHHIQHPRSLVYCHTPPRFLYDTGAYVRSAAAAALLHVALAPLRRRDRAAATAQASYVANSRATAQRIELAYHRSAPVVYPPLTTDHLPREATPIPAFPRALLVARPLAYKRTDVAIEACRRAGIPLTVVGQSAGDRTAAAYTAGADVTFAGRVSDDELAVLFARHSLVLAPGREDFGYGPVEANFAGRPTVAVGAGGALETVVDGKTGYLVDGWDPDDWAAAIHRTIDHPWDPAALRDSTSRFSADAFDTQILEHLASL